MVICNGQDYHPLTAIEKGARTSLFTAQMAPTTARKNWILSALQTEGTVMVDKGACAALTKGRSLLPAGVIQITGQFDRGDLIDIYNDENRLIGRGLAGYSAAEADKLKGQKSAQFEDIIGYDGRAELVHADNLVLIDNK